MADDKIERQSIYHRPARRRTTVNIARMQEGMVEAKRRFAQSNPYFYDEQIAILVEESKEAKAEFKEMRLEARFFYLERSCEAAWTSE